MNTDLEIREFKKGETFSDVRLPHSLHKHKIHIVDVIDEGLTFCPMVVYRYWLAIKQRWQYEICTAYELTYYITPRTVTQLRRE